MKKFEALIFWGMRMMTWMYRVQGRMGHHELISKKLEVAFTNWDLWESRLKQIINMPPRCGSRDRKEATPKGIAWPNLGVRPIWGAGSGRLAHAQCSFYLHSGIAWPKLSFLVFQFNFKWLHQKGNLLIWEKIFFLVTKSLGLYCRQIWISRKGSS